MSALDAVISADTEMRTLLDRLAPDPVTRNPADVNELLARVVWSRLIEPGDAVAGDLIAALGAHFAINQLAAGANARELCASARAAGTELEPRRLTAAIKRWLPRLDRQATLTDLARGTETNMRLIDPTSALWPQQLGDLGSHAPLLLWARGDVSRLAVPALAVVGARACTGYGTHVTAEFTEAACAAGVSIVSGAAYGIDAVAHRTALATGATTVAVVAGGSDRPYPLAHTDLLGKIAEAGVICSEMIPGAAPTRWRFLMRNRVIAALSTATLVTEAGARSGSLNTAGNAAEIGRPLGAVPGPVTSAASTGCHRLIREYGASVITQASDVHELLGCAEASEPRTADPMSERGTPRHRQVLDALPLRGSRNADETARRAGLSNSETRETLAELELLGSVTRHESPEQAHVQWSLHRRE